MPPAEAKPALFLDRDGVLNELVHYPDTGEWESPRCAGDFRLLPGVGPTLAGLKGKGWPIFIVSNQPSFAKGKTTLEALKGVHQRMMEDLARDGVTVDGSLYCYHHPAGTVPEYSGPCPCRKPSPFLLVEAARNHGLDLGASWMVGDQDMDLLCGRSAGCRTILIPCEASRSKRGGQVPDVVCAEFADILAVVGQPFAKVPRNGELI